MWRPGEAGLELELAEIQRAVGASYELQTLADEANIAIEDISVASEWETACGVSERRRLQVAEDTAGPTEDRGGRQSRAEALDVIDFYAQLTRALEEEPRG